MPPEDTQDPLELEAQTFVSCAVYMLGSILSCSP